MAKGNAAFVGMTADDARKMALRYAPRFTVDKDGNMRVTNADGSVVEMPRAMTVPGDPGKSSYELYTDQEKAAGRVPLDMEAWNAQHFGQDGRDGADGQDGADGLNGADGKDGINGANGRDGKDGLNGKDAVLPFAMTGGITRIGRVKGLSVDIGSLSNGAARKTVPCAGIRPGDTVHWSFMDGSSMPSNMVPGGAWCNNAGQLTISYTVTGLLLGISLGTIQISAVWLGD